MAAQAQRTPTIDSTTHPRLRGLPHLLRPRDFTWALTTAPRTNPADPSLTTTEKEATFKLHPDTEPILTALLQTALEKSGPPQATLPDTPGVDITLRVIPDISDPGEGGVWTTSPSDAVYWDSVCPIVTHLLADRDTSLGEPDRAYAHCPPLATPPAEDSVTTLTTQMTSTTTTSAVFDNAVSTWLDQIPARKRIGLILESGQTPINDDYPCIQSLADAANVSPYTVISHVAPAIAAGRVGLPIAAPPVVTQADLQHSNAEILGLTDNSSKIADTLSGDIPIIKYTRATGRAYSALLKEFVTK